MGHRYKSHEGLDVFLVHFTAAPYTVIHDVSHSDTTVLPIHILCSLFQLWNQFQVCAASQKKSLAGLDATQTDGVLAFSSLEAAVTQLSKLGKNAWL